MRTIPLVHWGEAIVGGAIISIDKALSDLEWTPAFGLEAGYTDSYEWFAREGRDLFEYDFSADDAAARTARRTELAAVSSRASNR